MIALRLRDRPSHFHITTAKTSAEFREDVKLKKMAIESSIKENIGSVVESDRGG
jgi:hypothetical protein